MSNRYSAIAVTLVITVGFANSQVRADDADPKKLEAQVVKLLDAYNKDDVKAFFTGWAKSAEALTTEQIYDLLYKMGAKKDVGDYTPKSVKFRKDGSVLSGDILVVYFEAAFSKEKDGLVTVNFTKEGEEYKFLQVRISKAK
jgi:hypothetical protein